VSILQERQSLGALAAVQDEGHGAARFARYAERWVSLLAGQAMPVGTTLALVWLATVGLVVINYFVAFNLVTLIYMLPVVVAATQWGLGPGIVAAVAGAAAADFFFYPPLYTFWIRDPQNVVDLVLFLLIAVVTSNLAARLKNEAVALQRRAKEITELHAFSQGLATCLTSRDLIFAVQDYLSNTLRYQAALIATDQEMHVHAAIPEDVRRQAGKLIASREPAVSTLIDPRSGRAWLVRIINPEILGYGAIAIDLGDSRAEYTDATARRVETLLEEATLTLKHLKAKEAIEQATSTIKPKSCATRSSAAYRTSCARRLRPFSALAACSIGFRQSRATVNRANWSRRSTSKRVNSTTKSAICSMPRGSAPRAFVRS
jgi:K+-sensing histidine kinase KdpD